MEVLAALSLASAILHFVDFSIKIVSKGYKIYHSGDGSLSENNDLEIVVNDLVLLQARLQCATTGSNTDNPFSKEEASLLSLRATANELAANLLDRLNMVKAQGKYRRWKSFRQALKSIWSKREVNEMAQRLEVLKTQLTLRVIVSIR
jgi:hypothetical protein